ncbi:KRAB-A domain-containing protein 2-like [Anthonomus grandis grandis]|uniref:KRAB-A domain-containing protein 2-like n=1 Tax=Anthonomus grandis grandis TaxID=2921223 RepID=UPI00216520C1|nr:KRAB-A domain-containing protein 2-like [Anthonomus grandis grandis]
MSEMNSRCQVDLIDMQSEPDGEYKFILNYQDHLTKFVILRPLKTKTANKVADVILDIFCLFGAPNILHSDNGREFSNQVIEQLAATWSAIKIVHGKPRHSQSQGSVERANQDVRDSLVAWMSDNNCQNWAKGLRVIQSTKNRSFHTANEIKTEEQLEEHLKLIKESLEKEQENDTEFNIEKERENETQFHMETELDIEV